MRDDLPFGLLVVFVPFSLVSIGGGPSVFAGIQHQVVDVHQWLTAREFIDLFAISRAAPGPGTMLATAIGWHMAGWTGAVLATIGLFVPSSLLCYAVVRVWSRHRGKVWHTALEEGLAPVGSGLILAGVVSILGISGGGPLGWGLALAAAGLLTWRPKLHPLLLFVLGAAVFVAVRAVSGGPG
jgi:chromate transporter